MDGKTWEISYPVTRKFLRRMWTRTWWRSGGRRALVILAVFLAMNLLITLGWNPEKPSHFVAVAWAVFGTSVVCALVAYRTNLQLADRHFEAMSVPIIHCRLDERSVRTASDDSALEVNWRAIGDVWRYPDMWLLVMKPVGTIALPAGHLNDELRAAILRWIAAAQSGRGR